MNHPRVRFLPVLLGFSTCLLFLGCLAPAATAAPVKTVAKTAKADIPAFGWPAGVNTTDLDWSPLELFHNDALEGPKAGGGTLVFVVNLNGLLPGRIANEIEVGFYPRTVVIPDNYYTPGYQQRYHVFLSEANILLLISKLVGPDGVKPDPDVVFYCHKSDARISGFASLKDKP